MTAFTSLMPHTLPASVRAAITGAAKLPLMQAASFVLAFAGAAVVVAGVLLPWATFYRGLVERNGLAGDGAYMTGLAVAAVVASVFGLSPRLAPVRWIALAAAVCIALIAARDLRNIYALEDDAAASAYFVDAGRGLPVVLAGAALIAASAIAGAGLRFERAAATGIFAAAAAACAAGLLVAGGIAQYHLHLASGGHAHTHVSASHPAYVMVALGIALLPAASSAAIRALAGARATPPRD